MKIAAASVKRTTQNLLHESASASASTSCGFETNNNLWQRQRRQNEQQPNDADAAADVNADADAENCGNQTNKAIAAPSGELESPEPENASSNGQLNL